MIKSLLVGIVVASLLIYMAHVSINEYDKCIVHHSTSTCHTVLE